MQSSVVVVRGMWEAFLGQDIPAALAAFDPDVEWDGRNFPDGKVSRGHQAVLEHVGRWREMWEGWEVTIEDVIDAGEDRVLTLIRERGRSKAGIEMDELHATRGQGRQDPLPQGLL
ncbi:MAG TPA: nuclear transport factor 2 family protein [Solirubrobacteraceae bacterium]|jgi:hypothetical protein|nr:nuclear transport factor 2 family protein [Solirubrobacteraceae bacterium]